VLLKLATGAACVALASVVEWARHNVDPGLFAGSADWLALLVGLAGGLVLVQLVFGAVEGLERRLERQYVDLAAVREVGLTIIGDLDTPAVLRHVVEGARELLGARYSALLAELASDEPPAFVPSGMSDQDAAAIGRPPRPDVGLFAVPLEPGQVLRIDDIARDPRAGGFPPFHPPMRRLLAVALCTRGRAFGKLFVADRLDGEPFDVDDEQALRRLATVAALALGNASLHRRVQALAISQERDRLGREMHDSLAQVLGYVSAKSQAIRELIGRRRLALAERQLDEMSEVVRSAYADVREAILGLRATHGAERHVLDALDDYLKAWQMQSGVRGEIEVQADEAVLHALDPNAELQVLRIVQEALANVRKHARARRATVRLTQEGAWLLVCVEDDGRGFDPSARVADSVARFGLATMEERARSFGGALSVESQPGRGTRVRVRVPLTVSLTAPLRSIA
jgi:signal transduction histidine kinase